MHILQQTWQALDLSQHDDLFQDIMLRYQEPWRAYHTLQHLAECFDFWQQLQAEFHSPKIVALALFYHDIVYDPRSNMNEEYSSQYAVQKLAKINLNCEEIEIIRQFIFATKTHQNPFASHHPYYQDLNYLLDIDLAILASTAERFSEYEQQIRQEYQWVEINIYQQKRHDVLYGFYQQRHLFKTEFFQNNFQVKAKDNLKRLLNL
ncbi:metal-dependent hydrolase [Acinetobacter sp. c2-A9]|uniref:HD domain-containing protein n=1 Tax=Acinetobacter sp. c2-A9 TaxID=3342802 RepID=UPI0035B8DFEC